MNRCLDCIQIWYDCSLGISDNLINFSDESIKKKLAAKAIYLKKWHRGSVGHFFSLFLDIDGQSLRLRVLPSIDGYFCLCSAVLHCKHRQLY